MARLEERQNVCTLMGMPPVWVFEVENFGPFLVDSDLQGNSLFEQHTRQINAGLGEVYAGLNPPALGRFGETDDRSDELV